MTFGALDPRYQPDTISAKAGTIQLYLVNIPISIGPPAFGPHHNIMIGREIGKPIASSGSIEAGRSVLFTVEQVPPGTYRYWCTATTGHGPHFTLGMVGTLTVTP